MASIISYPSADLKDRDIFINFNWLQKRKELLKKYKGKIMFIFLLDSRITNSVVIYLVLFLIIILLLL